MFLGQKVSERESQKKLRIMRREVGFVFQQFNLINTHTVLSNVLMGRLGYMGTMRGLLGMFSSEDEQMAADVLKEVGLKDQINKRVDQLSGGQQQRVAIARAIVQQPKIILADEPMASLDPKLSEVVLDLLYKFNQERKITVLVNVHVLELAKRRATRIIGLKKGCLVFDGTPDALTSHETGVVYGD
jgi:phosphonate transport system ATP-binding protein